jgi:hypothetical protein
MIAPLVRQHADNVASWPLWRRLWHRLVAAHWCGVCQLAKHQRRVEAQFNQR